MGFKTKIFALMAACVVLLLLRETARGPAATHADEGGDEVVVQAAAPAPLQATRARSTARAQPPALGASLEVLREWSEPMGSVQDGGIGGESLATAEPSEVPVPDDQDEMLSEDPSIYPWEPSDKFWQWRRAWADEAPDPIWAEQLHSEFSRRTGAGAGGATLHQVDCRETLCQMYLHTNEAQNAEAIIASMGGAQLEYEELGDHVQLEDAPAGGVLYEVVVRRDRPTSMPPHVPGAARAYALAEQAQEGNE